MSSRVSVHYLPVDGREAEKQAEFVASIMPAKRLSGQPFKVTLTDLKPQRDYQYRISIDGKFQPFLPGIFRTAPIQGESVKFRVGVTSCMKTGAPQSSWKLFLAENPTLHLTLGDTHYANSTDPNKQWSHHLRYRRELNFSKVIAAMPTYAMWDDHDYGPNDSDGSARGKESSLESWKAVWANPNAGTERTPGAFFTFSWGDVDFFVIDERYYRSPNKARDDDRKRMLGEPQFEWLLNGLKNSKAKFKVIASGSTLHHSTTDGWRLYTFARRRLFNAIKVHKISGVVFFSGDIHSSLVWVHHESELAGYRIIEVISSGITNGKALSFATVDFDTTLSDPTMRVRIVHGNGKVYDEKVWKLSQLEVRDPPDIPVQQ
ncbi:MAG: alkaline phosphatase family protein, partial [Methyloprofundus sp.]|nr:alkaline phosphatase family protein [Methyloprofundus sp.]